MHNLRKLIAISLIFILIMVEAMPSFAASGYMQEEFIEDTSAVCSDNSASENNVGNPDFIISEDDSGSLDSSISEATSGDSVITITESDPDSSISEGNSEDSVSNISPDSSDCTEDVRLEDPSDDISPDTAFNPEVSEDAQLSDNPGLLHPEVYNISDNYTLEEVNQHSPESIRYRLVMNSLNYLGNPYVWGGTSLTNGADCSGFTQSLFKRFHISLPRTAAEQYQQAIPIEYKKLQPGDLVFYANSSNIINHVAIYIGNHQIIHASSPAVGIIVSNINYRTAFGYGSYITSDLEFSKLESGYYVSNVIGNYYNRVRASAYTIGQGTQSNIGMGLCCNHNAATASAGSSLTQSNSPEELEQHGFDRETQFRLAILCSLAPYGNGGSLDNPYINWESFGCSTPSQANALCSLACSYLCGHDYGNIPQAVQLANWVIQHSHEYWDFWGNIQNTSVSNTNQQNIHRIIKQDGVSYYMTTPVKLSGNAAGSTFKITNPSTKMQAVVSDSDIISSISDAFTKKKNSNHLIYYTDATKAVMDKDQYITFFYKVSPQTTGKKITADIIPTKAGAIYRLNYYFPAGSFQPVVMCDGTTTNKTFSLSFVSSLMHEIIIKKSSGQAAITKDNPNYSLKGATYNIYTEKGTIAYYFTDSNGSLSKAENLITDEDGKLSVLYNSKKTANIHVLPGIYYVKEVKASPGYQLDTCSNPEEKGHYVDVRTKVSASVTCKEPPVSNPVNVKIYKKELEPGTQTDQHDLSGAVFKVCYYNKIYRRFSDIKNTPTRTWYLETKKNSAGNYVAVLDTYHLSSQFKNSGFYKDAQGKITLPLGTITISEIKPPANFHNVNFHGRFYDGVNHIYDVVNTRQGTFYGTIRQDNRGNACLYVGNSGQPSVDTPVYSNLSLTYSDRIIPTIKTNAFITETGSNLASSVQAVDCYDLISIKGLLKGKTYTVISQLVNRKTGETVKDSKGNDCVHSSTFTANNTEETHKVFVGNISGKEFAGQQLVIQESIKWDNTIIATENDLNNTDQTIYFPIIHTKAVTDDNSSYASSTGIVSLTDTISYKGLLPDKTYTIKGSIMYLDEKNQPMLLKDSNGNPCVAEKTFIPKKADGTVDIVFSIDTQKYPVQGLKTVIFEEIYYNDFLLASHKDMNDANQTIYFPDIKTTLICDETNSSNMILGDVAHLTDSITYKNLAVGEEYTVKGVLVNKKTGDYIKDANGNIVTGETTFIPDNNQGTVAVNYIFNVKGTDLANQNETKKEIVCYENIYRTKDNRHIVNHENIDDTNQTVCIPGIKTTAWEKVSHTDTADALKDVTIVDTIAYSGLIKGETYEIKGQLMIKDTQSSETTPVPLFINNKPVTNQISFTADSEMGEINIEYRFDASSLKGKDIVVFEDIYYNDYKIASHRDINCQEQTIHFTTNDAAKILVQTLSKIQEGGSNGNGQIQTGDSLWKNIFMILFMISCSVISAIYFFTRRKKRKKCLMILLLIPMLLCPYMNSHAKATDKQTKTITKTYENLENKDNSEIPDTIEENSIQYQIKSIQWEEVPLTEHAEYTVYFRNCTKQPDYSETYDYTYTSPTNHNTLTVTLPFIRLEKGVSQWVDGFRAIATFQNIKNGVYTLGNHSFSYSENMELSADDYNEIIKLLDYDSKSYRFYSYEWKGEGYIDEDGNLSRDAILYGQQYATNYNVYYGDTVEIGTQYNAIVQYEPITVLTEPTKEQNTEAAAHEATNNAKNEDMNRQESLDETTDYQHIENETDYSSGLQDNLSSLDNLVTETDLKEEMHQKQSAKMILNSICFGIIIICLFELLRLSLKRRKTMKSQKPTINERI